MIYRRSYISKLGAFSPVCRFSLQYDLHKIIHLQTRGIHSRLSILSTRFTIDHAYPNQGHSPQFVDFLINIIYTRSYISKLRAFSPDCRFSFNMIYIRLYISKLWEFSLFFFTKQSSLNMIHTRSHVFETKGIRPHFSIGQIFKLKGTPPSLPLAILIKKVIQNLSKGHCSFIILMIQENFQSLHLFNYL